MSCLPRKLWSKLRVTAIVPATARERIVAALEFARHLFVGRSAARHQHHVEAGQTENWDGQYGDDGHQYHSRNQIKFTLMRNTRQKYFNYLYILTTQWFRCR